MSEPYHHLNDGTLLDDMNFDFEISLDNLGLICTTPLEDLVQESEECYNSFLSNFQEPLPVSEELLLSLTLPSNSQTVYDPFELLDGFEQLDASEEIPENSSAPPLAIHRLVREASTAAGKRKAREDCDLLDGPSKRPFRMPPLSRQNSSKKTLDFHSIESLLPESRFSPVLHISVSQDSAHLPAVPAMSPSPLTPAQVPSQRPIDAGFADEVAVYASGEYAFCSWPVLTQGTNEDGKVVLKTRPCDMTFFATPTGLKKHMESEHKISMKDRVLCVWPTKDGKPCCERERIHRHILTKNHVIRTKGGQDISRQICPNCKEELANRPDALKRHMTSSKCMGA